MMQILSQRLGSPEQKNCGRRISMPGRIMAGRERLIRLFRPWLLFLRAGTDALTQSVVVHQFVDFVPRLRLVAPQALEQGVVIKQQAQVLLGELISGSSCQVDD